MGARVGEFVIDESDHALIYFSNREQGSAFSCKYPDGRFEVSASIRNPKNFKLKSLILAQIERWRHA